MSSNQEEQQEAGPSGISREETLSLLGQLCQVCFDMSDHEDDLLCPEVMEDSEEG